MADHVHMLLIPRANGIWAGWVHQGEERDSDRTKIFGSDEKLNLTGMVLP